MHDEFQLDRSVPGVSRRTFMVGAGAFGAAAFLAACGGSSSSSGGESPVSKAEVDGDLSLLMYDGYVADSVVKSFEQEYGVKVKYNTFSSGAEGVKKLAAGLPFDIAVVSSTLLTQAVEGNLLREIDHDKIEHYDQVLPAFQVPAYTSDEKQNEKNARYVGTPYAMGGIGVVWRTDKLGETMTGSFNDLWDNAAKASGHTFFWDDPQYTIALSLARLGYDINRPTQKELDEAIDALREIKSHSRLGSTVITPDLVNGQGWLMMGYTGDTFQALNQMGEKGRTLRYELGKENRLFNDDNVVIPAKARHPGTAMLFIDWMLRPENMKELVDNVGYPVPTTAGIAAYDELTRAYPWLRAQEQGMDDPSQWVQGLDRQAERAWLRAWTKYRAG